MDYMKSGSQATYWTRIERQSHSGLRLLAGQAKTTNNRKLSEHTCLYKDREHEALPGCTVPQDAKFCFYLNFCFRMHIGPRHDHVVNEISDLSNKFIERLDTKD